MKRLFLYLILLLYINSNTEFFQLLKLPVLFEHYYEHRNETHEISFLDFLYNHYALSDDGDNDMKQDIKLPFKSSTKFLSDNFYFFCLMLLILELFLFRKKMYSSIKKHSVIFEISTLIWQPPKIVMA